MRIKLSCRNVFSIRLHRALINVSESSGLFDFILSKVDPLSSQILLELPWSVSFPAFTLCYFGLRYSELNFLSLKLLLSAEQIQLYQPKTKTYKTSLYNPFHKFLSFDVIHPRTPFMICSYDQISYACSLAAARCGISLPDDCMDSTHIFRHLRASYMRSQKLSLKEIRSFLGHSSKDSVSSYLHKYETLKA